MSAVQCAGSDRQFLHFWLQKLLLQWQ